MSARIGGRTNTRIQTRSLLRPAAGIGDAAPVRCDGHRHQHGVPQIRPAVRQMAAPSRQGDDNVLVIRQPSNVYNPNLDEPELAREIQEDIAADPERGAAEWLGEWRTDIADFVSREVVEALVAPGRFELPCQPGIQYVAVIDPSGGSSDSMTLAIGHTAPTAAASSTACARSARPSPRAGRPRIRPNPPILRRDPHLRRPIRR